jgi:D-serine deaminase-like pyridoxal phosphate-dependent protein
MDREYVEIGGRKGPVYDDFVPALTVLATVISVPGADRVVLDAGMKSLSTDAGPAAALGVPGWEYVPYGDEHGMLTRIGSEPQPRLGDVIRLLPGHCDTTVNLYDRFHVARDGKLIDIWLIAARGRSQ